MNFTAYTIFICGLVLLGFICLLADLAALHYLPPDNYSEPELPTHPENKFPRSPLIP
jgi:hypothetical protein